MGVVGNSTLSPADGVGLARMSALPPAFGVALAGTSAWSPAIVVSKLPSSNCARYLLYRVRQSFHRIILKEFLPLVYC